MCDLFVCVCVCVCVCFFFSCVHPGFSRFSIYYCILDRHNGKNLINLQKLPAIKTYTSVHHVSSYCPDPDQMRKVNHIKKALVRVHHYLGTEEQYFFRSDPRQGNNATTKPPVMKNGTLMTTGAYYTRDKKRFKKLNQGANYPDQGARAWIRGFIDDVGLEKAKFLLEGVGKVGTYYNDDPESDVKVSPNGFTVGDTGGAVAQKTPVKMAVAEPFEEADDTGGDADEGDEPENNAVPMKIEDEVAVDDEDAVDAVDGEQPILEDAINEVLDDTDGEANVQVDEEDEANEHEANTDETEDGDEVDGEER